MLELSIDGGNTNGEDTNLAEEAFEISPTIVHNQRTRFIISVKNNKKLDYERLKQIDFEVNCDFIFICVLFV